MKFKCALALSFVSVVHVHRFHRHRVCVFESFVPIIIIIVIIIVFQNSIIFFLPFAIVLRCSALPICISCFRSLLLHFPINIFTLIYVNRSTNLVVIFVLLFSVCSHSAYWLSGRLSGLSVNAKSLLGTVYHGICTYTACVQPLSMYVVAFKLFHIKHGAALKRTTHSVT